MYSLSGENKIANVKNNQIRDWQKRRSLFFLSIKRQWISFVAKKQAKKLRFLESVGWSVRSVEDAASKLFPLRLASNPPSSNKDSGSHWIALRLQLIDDCCTGQAEKAASDDCCKARTSSWRVVPATEQIRHRRIVRSGDRSAWTLLLAACFAKSTTPKSGVLLNRYQFDDIYQHLIATDCHYHY